MNQIARQDQITAEESQHDRFNRLEARLDPKWVMQRGVSGRRVLLKGLPAGIPLDRVRDKARGYGLIEGSDAVVPLPQYAIDCLMRAFPPVLMIGSRTPGRKHSMHAFTVDSEANAYRLARKLNMTYHTTPGGEDLLMRAEVVW